MYPKDFFASSDAVPKNGKCFVIMPFAESFDEVYETIREAIEGPELSFHCARADDLVGGGHIIEDILRGIAEAEIVIADLTERNPNVFYELGIVQMVKDVEKIIMLSQDADSIPFDLQIFRSIIYQQTIQGAKELKANLIEAVKSVAEKFFRFQIHSGVSYTFPKRVMGVDRAAYNFEMPESFFADDGGKFFLRVNRYVIGKPTSIVFEEPFGLFVNESIPLHDLPWEIRLERIENDIATFIMYKK